MPLTMWKRKKYTDGGILLKHKKISGRRFGLFQLKSKATMSTAPTGDSDDYQLRESYPVEINSDNVTGNGIIPVNLVPYHESCEHENLQELPSLSNFVDSQHEETISKSTTTLERVHNAVEGPEKKAKESIVKDSHQWSMAGNLVNHNEYDANSFRPQRLYAAAIQASQPTTSRGAQERSIHTTGNLASQPSTPSGEQELSFFCTPRVAFEKLSPETIHAADDEEISMPKVQSQRSQRSAGFFEALGEEAFSWIEYVTLNNDSCEDDDSFLSTIYFGLPQDNPRQFSLEHPNPPSPLMDNIVAHLMSCEANIKDGKPLPSHPLLSSFDDSTFWEFSIASTEESALTGPVQAQMEMEKLNLE